MANRSHSSLSSLQVGQALLVVALSVAIAIWFIPVRSPLWLDETISYVQVSAGFLKIYARQGWPAVPAYSYFLWFFTKILGTSELALRIPSIVAMLGAVYLLYRAAKELFDRETAMVAVILFCLHPVVVFAAIDARPYAFAALAINATIYLLVRLRYSDSIWLAAAFGAMAAVIVWFHFLFGVILPALVIGFFAVKMGGGKPCDERRAMWRQFGVALAAFAIAFLPVIPGVLYMFRSRADHPFDVAPRFFELLRTLAPGWLSIVLGFTGLAALLFAVWTMPPSNSQPQSGRTLRILSVTLAFVLVLAFVHLAGITAPVVFSLLLIGAAVVAIGIAAWTAYRRNPGGYYGGWRVLVCTALGLIPILILYAVSTQTPLHIFVARYRLVGVPGIALMWALLLSGAKPRVLRMAFCVAIAALTVYGAFTSPRSRHHDYTWKYALEAAERNATVDNATVLICSDLPESDHMPLPVGDAAKDSNLFAPLSYYKLSVPVVPLPRSLNDEAMRTGSSFLKDATQHRRRFLAMGFIASYGTLNWIAQSAAREYEARELGKFDGVKVLEFTPRVVQLR